MLQINYSSLIFANIIPRASPHPPPKFSLLDKVYHESLSCDNTNLRGLTTAAQIHLMKGVLQSNIFVGDRLWHDDGLLKVRI